MKFFSFWLGIVCWASLQAPAQDPAVLLKRWETYENCTTCVVGGQLRSETKAGIWCHIKSWGHEKAVAALKKINPKLVKELVASPPTLDFDVDSVTGYTIRLGVPFAARECDYSVPAGMQPSESR